MFYPEGDATLKWASRTGIRQGTLEIVIEEVLWSIRGSYQTIWSFPLINVKWHSVTWPYTMTNPSWSDFVPNSTFYRIFSGFHRTFAKGVACRQGTLTPPDTWSRPFGACICSTCWDQSFSELVVILPDYALRISLGTFSILPFKRATILLLTLFKCLILLYFLHKYCEEKSETFTDS